MVNPNHITPYGEISDEERELTDDLVFNRREDALERFIAHFESKGEEAEEEAADPTEGMEPEEALHWHILRRKKDGVEDWIDRSVEKIGAVPTLNEVLLPAMKEVGDKFGAGELILPFVLQSAEVMKRAVAQLENYLDRIDGHTKGKVVIATVFGDVHDIGKSLVNTILTNNGYTVIDLGKQVPVDTIIEAAVENEADAIGLSALLVSTSKQMPICVQELHQRGLEFPVLIGGAAINRDFGRRTLYPQGQGVRRGLRARRLLLQGRLPGPRHDGRAGRRGGARGAGRADPRRGASSCARSRSWSTTRRRPPTTASAPPRAPTTPIPEPPFWGVREVEIDLDDVFPYLDRHVLFKLHWGGRGVKGEAWRELVEGDDEEEGFAPRLERMWREQDYLHPRARLGYFPCNADGNELVVFDPEDPERELERLVFPRQPKHDRICLADFFRPLDSGERDVVALQGVTVGPEVTELIERLEHEGEFAEQLYVHGLGVQSAEGLAEWLHARGPPRARHRARPGPPLLLGLPGLPGPVRAREGLAPARPRGDRHDPLRRLRGDARAVDGGDRRPPPAGRLLRHEVRLHPRGEGARRADRRHRARRRAAARGGSGRGRGRAGARAARSLEAEPLSRRGRDAGRVAASCGSRRPPETPPGEGCDRRRQASSSSHSPSSTKAVWQPAALASSRRRRTSAVWQPHPRACSSVVQSPSWATPPQIIIEPVATTPWSRFSAAV